MVSQRHKRPFEREALREQLRHVYWIGGGSAGGKSTIAQGLAAQNGFVVYASDESMADHARRSTEADAPQLHRFMRMKPDERWLSRTPQQMLETFHWFRGEAFYFMIDDRLQLPSRPGVIVDGFRLLPRLVAPLLSGPGHAVWLLPTPDFRQAVVERRGWPASGFLANTTDPDRALRNVLQRDRLFTDLLREEAVRLELNSIEVDGTLTEADIAIRVAEVFGL